MGDDVANYGDNGYAVLRGLFGDAERELLARIAGREIAAGAAAMERADSSGAPTKLEVRNELGDDAFSAVVRSRRMVETMERLLGGEVYHYHHKLMHKEPRGGGAWEWHQDYGYWYENGFLSPDLASCLLAISPATRANGCLQVLRGSHRLGRIDHARRAGQNAADPERVAHACERLESVHCELEPGDALFFHSNLLHCSARNDSDESRISLICCYAAAGNRAFKRHHHADYAALDVLEDAGFAELVQRHWQRLARESVE